MKIIIINGKIGSGKSLIGYTLHRKLINSAFIEGDAFLQTNPFNPTKDNYMLATKNIINQIKMYKKFKNIDYVILSWIIRDKEIFAAIKKALSKSNIYPICLDCPTKILKSRVETEIQNGNKFQDNILKINEEVYKENFTCINSNQDVEKIISKIVKLINN